MAFPAPLTALRESEYQALRATIRERGTMRVCLVLAGLGMWGGLALVVRLSGLEGAVTLVPLLVLAATFEVNFFIHTGVERVGRYVQVFYEEAAGTPGWETTAMNYGTRFPTPMLDPLFAAIFSAGTAVNFVALVGAPARPTAWIALSLMAHLAFAYRIVAARKTAAAQRATDLDRFRSLISK